MRSHGCLQNALMLERHGRHNSRAWQGVCSGRARNMITHSRIVGEAWLKWREMLYRVWQLDGNGCQWIAREITELVAEAGYNLIPLLLRVKSGQLAQRPVCKAILPVQCGSSHAECGISIQPHCRTAVPSVHDAGSITNTARRYNWRKFVCIIIRMTYLSPI